MKFTATKINFKALLLIQAFTDSSIVTVTPRVAINDIPVLSRSYNFRVACSIFSNSIGILRILQPDITSFLISAFPALTNIYYQGISPLILTTVYCYRTYKLHHHMHQGTHTPAPRHLGIHPLAPTQHPHANYYSSHHPTSGQPA